MSRRWWCRRAVAVAVAALLLGATSACGFDPKGFRDGRLFVVTALYPLTFLTERVGGDTVRVSQLPGAGVQPKITPVQIADIKDSALVVYVDGVLPVVDGGDINHWADTALDVAARVDLLAPGAEAAGRGGPDPRVWLDPQRHAKVAEAIAEQLGVVDPEHAAAYRERARTLYAELDALDRDYAAKLKTCQRREFVTSHGAFGYLADRYSLKELSVTDVLPAKNASLAAVAERARATGTTTVFFHDPSRTQVAEGVAREIGARTALLDPVDSVSRPGADYFSVMPANLAVLTDALGCSS